MARKVTKFSAEAECPDRPDNYGRFYTAIRAMSIIGDRDEVKRQIVWQYTDGRTESLREMTRQEYERCCGDLERKNGYKDQLRKERSATLKLMQKAGIDTTDWNRVNRFCLDRRIAGKEFARITAGEHQQLRRKIRAIGSKGGFTTGAERRQQHEIKGVREKAEPKVILIDIGAQRPGLN